MSEYWENTGFYWQPLGGNNIDQISGHSYQYTNVVLNSRKKLQQTTLIVDIGKFDNHQALGVANSSAAVPDIRHLLGREFVTAEAVFLTHSHPDHLNGIPHYLKAGYKLPPLYGGKYTQMILSDLYEQFGIGEFQRPPFHVINDGDILKIDSLEIEVLASSHTCFDSFGFIIKSEFGTVYHTGDMKIDSSTYFRKPTNIKRIRERAAEIDCVVADFYGIYDDGFAIKEVDTFKKLVSLIKKSKKNKIFIPVYPTHPEMYIIAFLAALKVKKNVVFFGNPDFYSYLKRIIDYGVSFTDLARNRIKVIYTHDRDEIAALDNNYAVIGTYNHVSLAFDANSFDSFGIVTAKTFFNPLKGQFNSHNIKFITVDEEPVLQGFGHGFLGDYEYLNSLLNHPVFIPTHCPLFMIDNFRELADCIGMNLCPTTPVNNEIYRIDHKQLTPVQKNISLWLAVCYNAGYAYFTEVKQKPTSGEGFLKRTVSARRCKNKFKIFLHLRKERKGKHNATEQSPKGL